MHHLRVIKLVVLNSSTEYNAINPMLTYPLGCARSGGARLLLAFPPHFPRTNLGTYWGRESGVPNLSRRRRLPKSDHRTNCLHATVPAPFEKNFLTQIVAFKSRTSATFRVRLIWGSKCVLPRFLMKAYCCCQSIVDTYTTNISRQIWYTLHNGGRSAAECRPYSRYNRSLRTFDTGRC